MTPHAFALWTLENEARALLARLGRVRSFALQETMVSAARISVEAQAAIERFLGRDRRMLRDQVLRFLNWLSSPAVRCGPPARPHRRLVFLRLRFNAVLAHLDIFNEALSQRSEAGNGVWLAGLDVASRDALAVPGVVDPPPVICYLARGPGAAIRRARTRLPGGDPNPVAIVRVPRERMIGSGIAPSLVHEVGHQGAALLDLVTSLRGDLRTGPAAGTDAQAWRLWRRWIPEIVADLWSVARLGPTSTAGLIGVVSLPSPFVFRINAADPHPAPHARVQLSAAIGEALYPHAQWRRLAEMWRSFYDIGRVAPGQRQTFAALEATMPALVERLLEHRSAKLRGRSLAETLRDVERRPERLAAAFDAWAARPGLMYRAAPTLAFAVLGQARLDRRLEPEHEADLVSALLRHWAWRAAVELDEACAAVRRTAAAYPPAPARGGRHLEDLRT